MDEEVTHLVCSAECWKSQSAAGELNDFFSWAHSRIVFMNSLGFCSQGLFATKMPSSSSKALPEEDQNRHL